MKRSELESLYKELGNELPRLYPSKNFKNHCYWRIALDNTLNAQWNSKIDSPAYKNLSDTQISKVVELLRLYKRDEETLMVHNTNSLNYRGKL